MKYGRWLVTLAPAVLGAGLALYFFLSFDLHHDHIVYLRADLGSLSLILGLGLSGLAALVFALLGWSAGPGSRSTPRRLKSAAAFCAVWTTN